ncbi:hypothetical protein Ldro_2680 [Legionella drozanskii LLAP-1]|uniref:Cyclic GMP-AMP synthase n=2 Tax=Legionella drozanskii TaxID=96228 RepID=A0A0W0SMK3_9GAMM|nr:hypothetical protein Ldro_2680 [Legionella drozanskii LLAP-1]
MSIQKQLELFHQKIKVDTETLREKRDILINKIKQSLKASGHSTCDTINQGSYIYGVGVIPLGSQEYDIDVGLVFPIRAIDYKPKNVKNWVYEAVKNHTSNVEDRGSCIRVRYTAGYHVDLVVYAQFYDDVNHENYQLARKDGTWNQSDPKTLKKYIENARQNFISTKDRSGADQIQRVTRYFKRWNDLVIAKESPDKPTGLAMLLLVIQYLSAPCINDVGASEDIGALLLIAREISRLSGRIIINKPTPQYEDVFSKLDEQAMIQLKERFRLLQEDLEQISNMSEMNAINVMAKHFGDDFSKIIQPQAKQLTNEELKAADILDMEKAIPSYKNPAKPWAQ